MSDIRIRRAHVCDSQRICRVHRASITTLCSDHYTHEQIEAWAGRKKRDDYERFIRGAIVLVAEEGNEIVGFSILDARTGEIHALYVEPDHVRCGVGTRLLEATEREARTGALSKVTLNATRNSVTFYTARGFSSLGAATNTLPNGITLPCVRMERRL